MAMKKTRVDISSYFFPLLFKIQIASFYSQMRQLSFVQYHKYKIIFFYVVLEGNIATMQLQTIEPIEPQIDLV